MGFNDRKPRNWQKPACSEVLLAAVAMFQALPPSVGLAQDRVADSSDRWFAQAPVEPLEGTLVTDRPDFTESTDAIATGHAQLEIGYTFTLDRDGETRARTHTAPEFLLRLGVLHKLELRLGWEGYGWSETSGIEQTRAGRSVRRNRWDQGASDLSVGVKYKFAEQEGTSPHMGVIAGLTVPSGSDGSSGGDVEPEVVFLWAFDVDDRWSIAGNAGIAIPRGEGNRFTQGKASLSLACSVSDRVGLYTEYFGLYPSSEHEDAAHSVNGGVTYLVSDNFQLDARVGAGLNEEADDFFAGVGFAYRW
jgi:hypothetical protein